MAVESSRAAPALATEAATFAAKRSELVAANEGMYVIIHGDQVAGIYASSNEAFTAAMQRFGVEQPFLLRRITREDEVIDAPALALGVIDAKLP